MDGRRGKVVRVSPKIEEYREEVTYALGDLVGKGEPAQGSSNGSKS